MKGLPHFFRFATALIVAAAAVTAIHVPAGAQSVAQTHSCFAPGEFVRLDNPLRRVARQIANRHPVKIVAIGSSSTAGAGASSPANSYPSRLAVELKALFPNVPINVINRGVGGEEARDMLARFDRDVLADAPDLVIWQVGSNSVLRDRPLMEANGPLREGLRRLKAADADVILMNPQYAPKVIAKHEAERMVDLIDATAREAHVDLFQRFAVMRFWRLTEDVPFTAFVSADGLHMNDWSYGCIAKLLALAISEAVNRPTVTATARGRR
jgi:lysophospholipase L1-like esterase